MERVYAFTDEYGSHGWDLDNPSVSTHFIITAVIVEESKVDAVKIAVEGIRKHYFQTGEIKSSKVGHNHSRRLDVLTELLKLDVSFFPVVIDKRKLQNNRGLKYKKSFYKFMNERVHSDLRKAFSKLTVVADNIGTNDYMQSFIKYFQNHSESQLSFFDESELTFDDSKKNVLIQVADFISGTLAYVYDEHKKDKNAPNYLKILSPKISFVRYYPKSFESFIHDPLGLPNNYDRIIA